jgi:hypothetical protein
MNLILLFFTTLKRARFRECDRREKNVRIYAPALQANCDRGVRDGATRRRGEQEVSDLAG